MISLYQMVRKRLTYLALTLIALLLGLASRTYDHLLKDVIADHAGDALWAAMVYFGVRFLLVTRQPLLSLLVCLLFCYGIEFSQLYQTEWINNIRGTTLGALMLGRGFLIVDLWRYSLGAGTAFLLDALWIKLLSNPSPK